MNKNYNGSYGDKIITVPIMESGMDPVLTEQNAICVNCVLKEFQLSPSNALMYD